MTPRTSAIGYALLLALGVACGLVLTGCHLSDKGRAAVAATVTVRTLDAACGTFLSHEIATLPKYVDDAVIACNTTPDPVACYNGKVASREKAIKACRVYGAARAAGGGDWDALASEAKGALSAIGVTP